MIRHLHKASQAKNEQIVNQVNDEMIDLRNIFNKKKIPENENPDEVINIAEESLDFNKQQKGQGLKI